jgi:mannose-6-phosphate isomerase-like protein (cupin superfamily)
VEDLMSDLALPFLLGPGHTRRDDAILPFKLLAEDSGGALSACEFTLAGWEHGPVLHLHTDVDEAFYVVSGKLEAQLGDGRRQAEAGAFIWVPRNTPHTFANAGAAPVHVLALAMPGGVEHLFAEQAAHIAGASGVPDPEVMDQIGRRHGALTLGPPIHATNAPLG